MFTEFASVEQELIIAAAAATFCSSVVDQSISKCRTTIFAYM